MNATKGNQKPKAKSTKRKVVEIHPKDLEPLFPPHLDKIKKVTKKMLEHPGQQDPYPLILESQCGDQDDSQPVEQYDGTLGVSVAFVNAHQAPVGQLQWNDNLGAIYNNPGNVSGVRWGTGTMISSDLFLTCGHCFDQTGGGWTRPRINGTTNIIPSDEIATNMHVNFNYQVDPSGNLRTEQSFAVTDLVEYRIGGLDFAIVRLAGNPGNIYGTTDVATSDAAQGDMVGIIGHPAGQPKRIEAGPVTSFNGDYVGYNDIDTLGGNSGSGILSESNGSIIGVHTNGGCQNPGGSNWGVRISSILAQSATLQAITQPTVKFTDDGTTTTIKFSDDHTVNKVYDDGPVTIKFYDDNSPGTFKFFDDGGGATLKFIDDGGGTTLKFTDDGGTLKSFDDAKLPGKDKQFSDHKMPGMDAGGMDPWVDKYNPRYGGGGMRPFVLATPHHSMAWTKMFPGAGNPQKEHLMAEYENTIAYIHELLSQRYSELTSLDAEYQRLLAEYEEIKSGKA